MTTAEIAQWMVPVKGLNAVSDYQSGARQIGGTADTARRFAGGGKRSR